MATANESEEKKIVSDLPVNCKLCGVTIRQSRNLRRHIDQMHSKMKLKHKNVSKRTEKLLEMSRDMGPKNLLEKPSVDRADSSLMEDFSQDSFSQLTEEILNYSAGSESDESSFSNNTVTISSTYTNACLTENTVHNSHAITSPVSSTSNSSVVSTQTLPTLLEDDLCFQLSTKSDPTSTVTSNAGTKNDGSAPVEQFECSNLDDSCHVNDIALKELESQLFSVCFCSTENI